MKRLFRKLRARYRTMTLVTFAATALLAALTIPWIWQPGLWNGASWIGIPVPYFISLFLIPALMFAVAPDLRKCRRRH